ncbi:MAG: phosphatidate cytidylyltransferase [Planctomycetota bacterium]|nr:phosphatidate cytidylyltransferase [Planctomycetota bacterium]
MFSNLKKRIIISGQLIAFIAFLLVADNYLSISHTGQSGFYFLLALFSSLCFYEFVKMYENINIKLPLHFPLVSGLCGIIILWILWTFPRFLPHSQYRDYLILMMWNMPLLFSFIIFVIISLFYYLRNIHNFSHIFILVTGFVYIYLPFWAIARMRGSGAGIMLVIYFISVVKITDTIAYFVGSRFGRHKLAESISPNKTVEGFIAALVGASIIGMVIFYFLLPVRFTQLTPFWLIFIINFIIVLIAQIGDLLESYLKRTCQVKDSGRTLGSLGGMLDLTDSLLLSAPVAGFLLLGI